MKINNRTLTAVLIVTLSAISAFYWNSRIRVCGQKSNAMQALDFWKQLRTYPNEDIPSGKYYREYEYSKIKSNEVKHKNNSISKWVPLGPLNVPGRMLSVAINPKNPNTIYTGSASGGLWRSHTGGLDGDWERITTGFPVLGVMAIAINPIDTNIIYIGTGEVYSYKGSIGGFAIRTTRGSYGIGILKTTNAGTTWIKCLDWTYDQRKGVQSIKLNPKNPNTILAATTDGIYKSINGGKEWNLVLPVLMGEDIVINSIDTNLIIVSCGNLGSDGTGLYRTTNGGNSWTKLEGGLPNYSGKTLLDMYAANPNIVYASIADSLVGKGLWKTTNFGTTWIQVHDMNVQQYQGWFSHFVAIHPSDVSQVIHAGVPINKSYDGGSTLYSIPNIHVDHHNFAHHPSNPDIIYVVNDGGIYRSTNFGDSYENIGFGLQTAQFYNGFSSSAQDSFLAMGGLQDNNSVIYRGNSANWNVVIGGDGCWTAIDPTDDNYMYGESQYNVIYKSVDQGYSFSLCINGLFGEAAFVSPFLLSFSNPSILYSGRVYLFKSTDAASSWQFLDVLDDNPILSMAISMTNSDTVYLGTAPIVDRSHIFLTVDGGLSFKNITNNLPDRYPMDIAVDPLNSCVVYVVFGGFGSGHVFKSTNSGSYWEDITGILPDVPTLAVVVDPFNSNHVYVGNDIGVYISTNGGIDWKEYNEGLPEAVIAMDLNISITNKKLRLATHGNGAYQRELLSSIQPTSVSKDREISEEFILFPNFPNPFNATTVIKYKLPRKSKVDLKIFNTLGHEIKSIVDDVQISGYYSREFDASNLASGVYYCVIKVSDLSEIPNVQFLDVKKMVLIK